MYVIDYAILWLLGGAVYRIHAARGEIVLEVQGHKSAFAILRTGPSSTPLLTGQNLGWLLQSVLA